MLAFGGMSGLLLAQHPQPVKAASNYYVNDDSTAGDIYCAVVGNDINNGTSNATPKRTIQAIINTYDLEAGDIVYVDAGTYAEHVVIGAADSGLTLQGAGAGLTSVNGSATGICLKLSFLTQGTIDGFTFTNGGASGHGGGMSISDSSNIIVSNCTFSGNTANYGAGIDITDCSPTITNCIFSGNTANNFGAGIAIIAGSSTASPIITNCIFSGNTAAFGGGGISISHSPGQVSSPTITNCILWGDTGGEISSVGGGTVVTYSDIQGGYSGTGNINTDPLFVDAAGGDFHLQSERGHWTSTGWVLDAQTSPCIDAGDPLGACGNEPSPNGGRINMGAYGNTSQASKSLPATLNVTTNSDAGDDITFGVSLGADELDGSGLSIREALNWASADDNVTFDGTMSGQTVTLSGTRLTIDKDIILDGDLDDDGTPDITISGNSNIQVIYTTGLTATARLEGLTITGGYTVNLYGGGMYNHSSSPTISNCIFSNSNANFGGGMYNNQSSPTVTNCTFSNNAAQTIQPTDAVGGGICNLNSSSPTITGCTFTGNTAVDWGGAIFNHTSSSPVITNCIFTGNSATNAGNVGTGGGIYNYQSSPTITSCNFSGNSADGGGGIYNTDSSSPTITSCNFSSNNADHGGGIWNYSSSPTITSCNFSSNTAVFNAGGIYNSDSSSPSISNCNFSNNTANNGGGMYNDESTPTLTGCNFTANTADGGITNDALGGGMYNYKSTLTISGCIFLDNVATATGAWISLGGGMSNADSSLTITNGTFSGNTAEAGGGIYNAPSSPIITNCTFSGNSATYGGGIYNIGASSPTITNCILWGNTGGEVYNDTNPPVPSPVVTYCDVQGGYGGTGNIDADPLFANAAGRDFHLLPASPCIDVGNNTAPGVPATDFEGDARSIDGDGDGNAVVDMGVDETGYPAIVSFTPASACTGDSVTITGIRFTGATAVKFGGTDAASFTIDSDIQITAVVDSGSSGDVTVTTPGGIATKSGFTYIPTPTITSVTPASAYAGSAVSVAITGANLTGVTAVSFGPGITTSSFTIDSSTQITAVIAISSSAALGTRDVSVTTPGDTVTLASGFSVLQVAGGEYAETAYYLKMDLLGTGKNIIANHSGKVQQTVEITSEDDLLTVTIPEGTVARQENGSRLTTFGVTINENPPPPPANKNIIGLVYNFEPDGATFDPSITLTFTYDPETLPEGVDEEDLVLAFYDEDTGEWVECQCICDPDNNCITACVCHFTDFAIIATVPPSSPSKPAPAAFSLSDLTIQPAEVKSEETVTISVSVANTGGKYGSYTVVLEVNGAEEQTQSIRIAAGGTKEVDFTASREEPGNYAVKVGSLEGFFTVTVPSALPETPADKTPQQPEQPAEEGGINWYIIGVIIAIAILLAIFIPIWTRRRRAG